MGSPPQSASFCAKVYTPQGRYPAQATIPGILPNMNNGLLMQARNIITGI